MSNVSGTWKKLARYPTGHIGSTALLVPERSGALRERPDDPCDDARAFYGAGASAAHTASSNTLFG
jgi:hypothetical protein